MAFYCLVLQRIPNKLIKIFKKFNKFIEGERLVHVRTKRAHF